APSGCWQKAIRLQLRGQPQHWTVWSALHSLLIPKSETVAGTCSGGALGRQLRNRAGGGRPPLRPVAHQRNSRSRFAPTTCGPAALRAAQGLPWLGGKKAAAVRSAHHAPQPLAPPPSHNGPAALLNRLPSPGG